MKFTQTTFLGLALLVFGLVLCGAGLFILLQPAQYKATVRIRVEPEVDDPNDFNPYFIQTTFEIVASEMVLSNAVAALNVNDTHREISDAEKSQVTGKSIKWLRRHLEFSAERNMKIFDMSFTGGNPGEAAKIANAIANAYRNYDWETRRQGLAQGIKSWKERYKLEEKQISVEQTNVEDAKLKQLVQQHQLLNALISYEENQLATSPALILPAIEEPAKPPQFPVLRNYALGISLLIAGLFSIVAGLRLLRSSRQQSA